jgi:hypothetical protein
MMLRIIVGGSMDEVDRLLRHLEEVAEEIQALKYRLSYLEDHRVEIREAIKVSARGALPPSLALFKPPRPKAPLKQRRGTAMSLRLAADTVAQMGGDVDAQQLSEKLGISFDAARLRLARAARQGLLVRVTLGHYRAPTSVNGSDRVETLTAQTEARERPSGPSNSEMVKVD